MSRNCSWGLTNASNTAWRVSRLYDLWSIVLVTIENVNVHTPNADSDRGDYVAMVSWTVT